MIGGLDDLYRELLLDHSKRPRNRGTLETPPAHEGVGDNPLCGDKVTVYALVEDGRVVDVRFEGDGCAICIASASAMTERVKGLPLDDAIALFDRFHDVLTGRLEPDAGELGDLAAFEGVRRFPMRVKCATLPWHALREALRPEG
jgi:nitrogen fixation NifU-like protein